jgi:putative flippase GtrA
VKDTATFFRFILVGILNTAFGFGAYAVLFYMGIPVWAALIGGNVAGIVFNFFTTGGVVFADVSLSRLPRFVGVYLACYLVNYVSVKALLSLHLNAIESQALISPVIAVLSFFLMSRYVFTRKLAEPVV